LRRGTDRETPIRDDDGMTNPEDRKKMIDSE
jgi:hypothetical protein